MPWGLGLAIRELTVKERILLHLFDHHRSAEDYEVGPEVTQPGIASAVGIRVQHVTQYVRPLLTDGKVSERTAHVSSGRRRRKAYALTESGRLAAYRLRTSIKSEVVRVTEGGVVREVSISEILQETRGRATLLEVLRMASERGVVNLAAVREAMREGWVEMVSDAPQVPGFVGRATELDAIAHEEGGARLFVVRGVAGIGKTSLAAKACERLRGQRNIFWHRVQLWDTRDSILSRLGTFLAALGKPGLQAVLRRGDTDRAPDVFREDLSGTQTFLVFDDAHEASQEVLPFFRLLVEALAEATAARALILTRTAMSFYSRRDVVLRGVVEELELQGFESHEVAAYVSTHELRGLALEAARNLHGHPLFLELLRAHNPVSGTWVDVRRYLEEEVYTDLQDAERGMMKVASLYQVPVPREALFAHPDWPHDVLLSLMNRSLLRPVGTNRFEVHDTVRDFFASVLTPAESERLSAIALRELRRLASEARNARKFALCSSLLSNALQIPGAVDEQASLWEDLGDVSNRVGDILAVSVAYRAAAKSAPDEETAARAYRKMAFSVIDWGDFKSASEEVEAGLEALGDVHAVERGWLYLARSKIRIETGKWVGAKEDAKAALSVFEEFGDVRGRVEAQVQLAFMVYFGGMGEDGEPTGREYLERALVLSASLDDSELTAKVHLEMVHLIAIETGDPEEATKHFSAIEALPQVMESLWTRTELLQLRAYFHCTFDTDLAGARGDLAELMGVARQVRNDAALAQAKYLLAFVALIQEKVDGARRSYEEAAEDWRRLGNFRLYGNTLFHAGRCCLMEGDVEGFNRILRILEDPEMAKSGLWQHYPKMGRALDKLIKGELVRSRELFEELLHEVEAWPASWGSKFELPRVHLTFGVALRVMGREREAKAHIRSARELYQAGHLLGPLAEADVIEGRLTEELQRLVESR